MNSHRLARGPVLAAAVMAAAALTAPLAIAAPAAAPAPPKKAAAKPNDFNGDGIRDLAVGAPGGTAGKVAKAGHVSVLYGSKSKPLTAQKQLFHQDSPGVSGTAAAGDRYGDSLAGADLDRDGYADLVVGAPGDTIGGHGPNRGSVSVLWGSPKGLTAGPTLATGGADTDLVGLRLAVGDFDGDGDQDLALTESQANLRILSGPLKRDGSATGVRAITDQDNLHRITDLAAGDVNKDGRTDLVASRYNSDMYEYPDTAVWQGTAQGPAATPKVVKTKRMDIQGGDNLDVGDVNKDGYADIVVGKDDFREFDMDGGKGGRILFYPGSAKGADGSKAVVWTQDTQGVPGTAAYRDYFGSGVTVADVDGDGYGDIASGLPGKTVDKAKKAGSVLVLRGSAKGPTTTGAKVFTQSTAGVPGASEANDTFGASVGVTDLNGDNRPELVVGGTGEDKGAGAVWVLKGTKTGPATTGAITFGNGTVGAPAAVNSGFGSAFANFTTYWH
ncbi:FG-GAP-like repeat-containing protein [Streptomyces yaizuensis]|uniref:FG-GAP-like repeat-containing protein n=1 Tax=Streptomyces yaizuensis TaxID=2989713 RepID=A0ABQ5P9U1_9ACTN|nr:FG-GAP-like repeat-containing protein [Streptomyces sp. YSPA8]GLF99342.1 FG-GAP-like repeat-containing protein [Streptomyces sp. YSPA8]